MERFEPSSAAPAPQGAKTDDNPTNPAYVQRRLRKIPCNRESLECLNCRKAGVACETSNRGKRVNQTRQLCVAYSLLARLSLSHFKSNSSATQTGRLLRLGRAFGLH